MKSNLLLIGICLLMTSAVQALTPAVIGGIRDGVALGLMAEESINKNVGLRFGVEATTGEKPLLLFVGGKFPLTMISRRYPMALGVGLIGYFGGNKSVVGPTVSLVFDRPCDINNLFIETGIDVAGSGKLQLQVGYKI